MKHGDVLERLARESGRRLGELGVRPDDERWLKRHAETIASLTEGVRSRRNAAGLLLGLARRLSRAVR